MSPAPDANPFGQVLAAFEGARFPLDPRSSKVLRILLERPDGCDAIVRPDGFEARLGWYPSRHRYFLTTAPSSVSYLLDLASAPAGSHEVQAVIGPATVAARDYPDWSYDPRRIWLSRSWTSVRISVRRAEASDASRPSLPWPEPIDYPPPSFIELSSSLFCPACRVEGSRFRQIMGGYLVCSACGGSFKSPE
jgi:hypothetical protein